MPLDLTSQILDNTNARVGCLPVPMSQHVFSFSRRQFQDHPQLLFELVGLVQLRVRLGDELKPLVLQVRQILRSLSKRIRGVFNTLGKGFLFVVLSLELAKFQLIFRSPNLLEELAIVGPYGLPDKLTECVNCLASPLHYMEGIDTSLGVGNVLFDAVINPTGTVTADILNRGALFVGQSLEEFLEHALAVVLVQPDDLTGVVVDDHSDVLVSLAV